MSSAGGLKRHQYRQTVVNDDAAAVIIIVIVVARPGKFIRSATALIIYANYTDDLGAA